MSINHNECFGEGRFLSHARIYIHIQLANSNIVKTSDLSRKNLAEVESEVEVKYWIGGTTGETGFHSILFARFYPRRDPGRVLTNYFIHSQIYADGTIEQPLLTRN